MTFWVKRPWFFKLNITIRYHYCDNGPYWCSCFRLPIPVYTQYIPSILRIPNYTQSIIHAQFPELAKYNISACHLLIPYLCRFLEEKCQVQRKT
jgi:hypothetical protein